MPEQHGPGFHHESLRPPPIPTSSRERVHLAKGHVVHRRKKRKRRRGSMVVGEAGVLAAARRAGIKLNGPFGL